MEVNPMTENEQIADYLNRKAEGRFYPKTQAQRLAEDHGITWQWVKKGLHHLHAPKGKIFKIGPTRSHTIAAQGMLDRAMIEIALKHLDDCEHYPDCKDCNR